MPRVFVTSDHHFDHANLLRFQDRDGAYFRGDRFATVEDMNYEMMRRWNYVVSGADKVYHLGDFCMSAKADRIAWLRSNLNGTIVLIRGNHDRAKLSAYVGQFKDVRATHLLEIDGVTVVLSHVPLHESALREGWVNVHGHTHEKVSPKGPYISACVEMTDYFPVEIGALLKKGNR